MKIENLFTHIHIFRICDCMLENQENRNLSKVNKYKVNIQIFIY